ncbi:prepilin-type N-terminal cleavage/methylation domain-containing protein [Paenibacillus allorhizosphaerae]|uniref:Prepilin-type N-terminal cleavage/methylation domain-containing protein n=1 Tax=Paenibacillus allorhizosphaerae TaxID=2849866 RepID=A0ABM8VLA3_9BACL|nr:prepilin-type N-terminal cleavage/methylation domain-containing protein [Paenibacillus allorhizosphaerae]CAG7648251.1 hypothetical protein PAECIP111802_04162 [Paenibacillus allorhizosphaerae]
MMRSESIKALHNEKGLSLIEVMAAMVILGILVISFMNISGYSILSNGKSSQLVDARLVAEDQLNKARLFIRANNALPSNPAVTGYKVIYQLSDMTNAGNYSTSAFLAHHISLQAVVLIQSVPKILTVTVSWS